MSIEQINSLASKQAEKEQALSQILVNAESDINAEFSEYNGIPLKAGGSTTISAYNTSTFTLTVNVDGTTTHTVTVKPYDDGRYYYQVEINMTSNDGVNYIQRVNAANANSLMLKLRMQDYIQAP
jgi:hypothetical protein